MMTQDMERLRSRRTRKLMMGFADRISRREPVAGAGRERGHEDLVLELADPRKGAAELARIRLRSSHDSGHERQQAQPDAHRASVPPLTAP